MNAVSRSNALNSKKSLFSGLLLAFCAAQVHAEEGAFLNVDEVKKDTSFYQPDFLIELAYGPDMSHVEIDMDFQGEKKMAFAGLYVSRSEYDMGASTQATMTAIGIRGLKEVSKEENSLGVDLHLGINQTKAGDYERTGIEIALNFSESITDKTSLLLGFTLRPEALAFDWDEDVFTESGLEFGVNHKYSNSTNLFTKYYYENLRHDNMRSERLDDGLLVGFNYLF